MAASSTWLQPFGPDIWTADGPLVRDTGLTFRTRMTVVRLVDGSLWVESPVSASPEGFDAIRALGEVRYLVSGTQKHTWRLAAWQPLFPDAQLWAPGKSSLSIAGRRVAVKDVLTDHPYDGWVQDVDQLVFRGSPFLKEVPPPHLRHGDPR